MVERVAAFTDTYLPTINGVTYTVRTWRDRFHRLGRRMEVVFPASEYEPTAFEHPVASVGFPYYEGYRLARPQIPDALSNVDVEVVHAHTPFAVGLGAMRYAAKTNRPFVTTYHTPASEYATYLTAHPSLARLVRRAATAYERWFYDRADLVIAPSRAATTHLRERVGVETPIRVVSNGVDLERFRPVDTATFCQQHGIDARRRIVGYTGRHGHEKRLTELVDAVSTLEEVTLLIAGDGPARQSLEERASARGVDAQFLGFLEYESLPAFYSTLDVFGFPSPVETQGVVALEAIACGTPVVAADAGALTETVEDGVTGRHYEAGQIDSFRAALERTFCEQSVLERRCLESRSSLSVDRSIDRVTRVYDALLEAGEDDRII